MDYKIISVESRKGGVGKTTAALSLAKILIDKGHVVLLIDADITGTNLNDSIQNSYWATISNPILYKKVNANLISLFNEVFMLGENLPKWSTGKSEKPIDFLISPDKINIIGSMIYENNQNHHSKRRLICNPSILFDELHSYWFIKFLEKICSSFSKLVNKSQVSVIIDNSPGFVGINPAIQDWLTDLGPTNGKFITVSSIDNQDLLACNYAIEDLHRLLCSKINGFELYLKADKITEKEFDLETQDAKRFYLRISSNDYHSDIDSVYSEGYSGRQNYIENPNTYQAIIINKVPLEYRNNNIIYDLSKLKDYFNDKQVSRITRDKDVIKISDCLVFYDESIQSQFHTNTIIRQARGIKRNELSSIKGNFTRISNILSGTNANLRIEENLIIDKVNFKDFSDYLTLCQKELERLVNSIRKTSLGEKINYFNKDWYPLSFIESLKGEFNEITANFELDELSLIRNNAKLNSENFTTLFKNIDQLIKKELKTSKLYNQIYYFYSFKAIMYFMLEPFIGTQRVAKYPDFFIGILDIQVERYSLFSKKDKNYSVNDFLSSEFLDIDSFQNCRINKRKRSNPLTKYIRSEQQFIDFYNSICKAQMRIISLNSDIKFLIDVLRQTTIVNTTKSSIKPHELRVVIDNVIINKTISSSNALNEIKLGIIRAAYNTEMQKQIKKIVNRWSLI